MFSPRLLPAVLLAASLAAGADLRLRSTTPPVLRDFEPADTSVVMLPGRPVQRGIQPERTDSARQSGPPLPAEFQHDAGLFCQRQIGRWTQADARRLLGPPTGRRAAADDDGADGKGGHILAFQDPTARFQQIELDFDRQTGLLRAVFAYPKTLKWQDCRRIWGWGFTATEAKKGRTFYSYTGRRLDVLVNAAGHVISLGLY